MASDTHVSGPTLPRAVLAGLGTRLAPLLALCTRHQRLLSGGLLVVFTLLLWVSFFNFPRTMPPTLLDGSWTHSYYHFFKHRLQAGVDYIQTGGPMMAFVTPAYDQEYFWPRFAAELVFKLALAVGILLFTRRMTGLLDKTLLFVLLLASNLQTDSFSDANIVLVMFLLYVLVSSENGSKLPYVVLYTLFLAANSLTIFIFLFFSVVLLFFLSVVLLRTRGWAAALVPFATYTLAFLGLWVALGQSPANIPTFLSNYLQTTLEYSQAVALSGDVEDLWLAGGILGLLAAALVPIPFRQLFAPGPFRDIRFLGTLAMLWLTLFLQWKHAFVRHDAGHAGEFFTFAVPVPLLFPALFPQYRWRAPVRAGLLLIATILSAIGLVWSQIGMQRVVDPDAKLRAVDLVTRPYNQFAERLDILVHPTAFRDEQDKMKSIFKFLHTLPRIRAEVRDEPVDLLPYELGMLFINELNWKPRPVFMSGSAYTPALAALNARFFRRADAPRYLLFRFQPIDERLPSADDNLALFEILWRYRPVLVEKSYLLLERTATAEETDPPPGEVMHEGTIRFDQEVDLRDFTDDLYAVALDIKPSLWGRARQFLFKAPLVFLHVGTDDGEKFTFRLVPGTVRDGVVLNPLLLDLPDVVNLYRDAPGRRVTSLRITSTENASYQDRIGLTIKTLPQLVAGRLSNPELYRVIFPMFQPAPVQVESLYPVLPIPYEGEDVLLVHAPGKVHLAVPEGAQWIVGAFGIMPHAEEQTDGVLFSVEFVARDGRTTVLFERHLDPQAQAAERGKQQFAVLLKQPSAGGRVVLKTSNRPGRTTTNDFSYWTNVEIQ